MCSFCCRASVSFERKKHRSGRVCFPAFKGSGFITFNLSRVNVVTPYLPLDLPHVNEILAQLGRQEVLSAEEGESPGRTVASPV